MRNEVLLLAGGGRQAGNTIHQYRGIQPRYHRLGGVFAREGFCDIQDNTRYTLRAELLPHDRRGLDESVCCKLDSNLALAAIFCNFTLHDKQRGYLSLLKRSSVLKKVDRLLDTAPEDIPEGSQYLMELDYSTLYNTPLERQSQWVLAMSVARRAGKQDATASRHIGCAQRKLKAKQSSREPRYDFSREETRLQHKLGITRPSKRKSLTGQTDLDCASNKRLRKPD